MARMLSVLSRLKRCRQLQAIVQRPVPFLSLVGDLLASLSDVADVKGLQHLDANEDASEKIDHMRPSRVTKHVYLVSGCDLASELSNTTIEAVREC